MKRLFLTAAIAAALTCFGSWAHAQTTAYFASASGPYGAAGNNSGLNIGQTFTVANTNIQVFSLGVYDYHGDGLAASHTVTLFSNQTALASVTVPAGTAAMLRDGFRFMPLTAPIVLPPGTYSVVAYQMNGSANNSDGYADAGNPAYNGFNGTLNLQHVQTIFEFSSSGSAYPGTGGGSLGTASSDLGSASFTYVDPAATTIAYTADPYMAQFGQAADNSGLNIGHTFTVTGSGITVFDLGVFDYNGNGLAAAHTVTLFTNQDALASVTVPAGTAAPLANGFRFAPLAAPITLPAGNYAIVVYQMNGGSSSDPYGEGNVSGFTAGGNVVDTGYSPYVFDNSDSPAYPSANGANENFAVCSFTYSNVFAPAVIVGQSPATVTVYAGTSPTLSVVAGGFPPVFTYQWYLNGATLIAGATNASYTLPGVTLADTGKKFTCTVANHGSPATTLPITLKVIAAPTQTYATTIIADQPLGYWRMNEGPDDGAGNNGVICNDYLGGNSGVYSNTVFAQPGSSTLNSDTAAAFGSYASPDSFAGSIYGVDFSTNANAEFAIEAWVNPNSAQYDAGIVSKGVREQFDLDTGASQHAFRFFVRDASGTAHLANSTNLVDGNWHHLVGVCDQANSNVLLYVDGRLSASATIAPNSGIYSTSVPMAIGARPSGNNSGYDWQFFGSIDEVAVYNHTLSPSQVLSHYYAAGVGPIITVAPTNTTASAGGSATFTVAATGTPALAYQWFDVTAGTPGTPLNGATNSTLVLTHVTSTQSDSSYLVAVTNIFGSATSDPVQLTVVAGPPVIQVDVPARTFAYAGRSVSLSLQAGGTLPLHYQWSFNGIPLTDSAQVTGSQSNVLTLLNVRVDQSGSYQATIDNAQGGPITSGVDVLQVISQPTFNTDGTGWTPNGSPLPCTIDQNVLTLTDGTGSEAKSCFFNFPLYVGGFRASFTYQDVTAGGADGVAFVLQNSAAGPAAVGAAGGGLGYVGISPSAALLFNVYGTVGYAFAADGYGASGYSSASPVDISSGDPISVSVVYERPILHLTMTNQTTLAAFSTDINVGDLPTTVGGNTAYVGFTGADGGISSIQTVSDFTYTPLIPLAVQTSPAGPVLSWPASVGGYSVQYTTDLASGVWQPLTEAVNQLDGQNQVSVPAAGQKMFYRLTFTPQ